MSGRTQSESGLLRVCVGQPSIPSTYCALYPLAEVILGMEGALRRLLTTAETKTSMATESLNVLSLKSGQLKANVAKVELKCLKLESKLILVEQLALKFDKEAKIVKETLVAFEHSMLIS
ncbi:hypothetical protein LWI28_003417 [Acer negundo]|uniref:Uncharacterized protein n=1 Tax=Acer negundo TaxID=4023 RepID=A0AAD5JGS2_ACENE|nr:hypothetical protein LWI28_003417 [Acer negundo]